MMDWQMVFLKIIVHSGFEIRLIPAEQPRAGGSETAEMQIRLLLKHIAPVETLTALGSSYILSSWIIQLHGKSDCLMMKE
jgi:hypothetical protein